jgi:hypothetical protein
MHTTTAVSAYCEAHRRSPALAFVLALVIGPVGVLYASGGLGAALIVLTVAAVFAAPPLALFTWLFGVIAAPIAASGHNQRTRASAELLAASRMEARP